MKRFSKLLAVVLAIAVIICPMMSVVSHATTTNGYKIEAIDANNLKLTISSTDGFVAYHAIVGFNSDTAFQSNYTDATTGYTKGLKVISYTLKTAQANDHNAPAISANASGTSLNVIVMPSDINNLDLCTEIVIGIRVANGTTASLTKIQAADNGTVDSEDANLLTFPAANESTGEIDQTAQYATENATTVHTHSFTLTSVQDATTLKTAATCTAAAVYYKTCSCGAVSNDDNDTYTVGAALGHAYTYHENGDGTHTVGCERCDYSAQETCDTEGTDGICSKCGYKAAPAEPPVDNNIACVTAGGLGTSAYISFYFTKSSLSSEYKSFEFRATRNVSGAGYMFTSVTQEITDTASTSTRIYYYVRGLELYAMSIPVTGVLYCKDASGNIIAKSKEFTATLADSLYSMYQKSSNAKQRRAIADVIVAGAEAQKFVCASAPTSDLALTVLPTEGKVLDDASANLEELASFNENNSVSPYTIGIGGGIGASPYLTFNFSGISNVDNYYVKLSYYNAIESAEKEKIVYLNDTNTDVVKKSGSKYYVYYKEMAIPATNAAVTAELYEIGNTSALSSYTYCLDAFFESRQNNASMGSLVVALAKLGQSFRAFNS